jgi:protein suppressor of PHYA-105 1
MRILPPELLEDRPREATFVLRCVHPDPDARPTAEMAATDPVLKEAKEGLAQRQSLLEIEEHAALHELCQGFLVHQQRTKRDRVRELRGHLAQIDADILEVERRFSRLGTAPNLPTLAEIRRPAPGQQLSSSFGRGNSMLRDSLAIGQGLGQLQDAFFLVRDAALGPAVAGAEGSPSASTSLHALQPQLGPLGPAWPVDYLTTFAEDLNKFVRYSKLEVGATLKHGGMTSSANMVCSLGFDRDEEYFATAGVCKKIKVFEFGGIMERPGVGMHFPVVEMTSQSKLSSISWNPYVKNHLASSDYDGTVHIWDVAVQKPAIAYEEHRKRVWSVGFSPADPMRLVSGSDDGLVKVWSVLQRESVMTINSHANVCCVQFNPLDQHHVAFGSADYKLYYYDLRKPSMPMLVLAGHNKAVSYVSFIDGQRLVSASTDNSLKLWDISHARPLPGGNQIGCERTFSGHANEKNFVGLSVNTEGFIACGSEDNNVYIYFRALPTPLGCTHFHGTDPITGQDTADAAGQFVSAVCWRQRGNILLAANSLGDIRALRLG